MIRAGEGTGEKIVKQSGEAGTRNGKELAFGRAEMVGQRLITRVEIAAGQRVEAEACLAEMAAVVYQFPTARKALDT